jgi:hypothetical protein
VKRIVLVVVTAFALGGCAASGPIATPSVPAPTPTTPLATPTTARPTATAKPTATTSKAIPSRTPATKTLAPETTEGVIAGAIGQVPNGFTLPDEQRAASDETTAFETTPWRLACVNDTGITASALDKLTATRIKASSGPEHVEGNGLLVFSDAAAAQSFLDQATAGYAACPAQAPADNGFRASQRSESVASLGEQAVRVGSWWDYDSNGTWIPAPGADLTYLARKGRFVALTYEGEESVGDPLANTELSTRAQARIQQILGQV